MLIPTLQPINSGTFQSSVVGTTSSSVYNHFLRNVDDLYMPLYPKQDFFFPLANTDIYLLKSLWNLRWADNRNLKLRISIIELVICFLNSVLLWWMTIFSLADCSVKYLVSSLPLIFTLSIISSTTWYVILKLQNVLQLIVLFAISRAFILTFYHYLPLFCKVSTFGISMRLILKYLFQLALQIPKPSIFSSFPLCSRSLVISLNTISIFLFLQTTTLIHSFKVNYK